MSLKQPKEKNIQVVLRCRPLNKAEKLSTAPPVIDCDEKFHEVAVKQVSGEKTTTKTFTFDKVYGPNAKQITIYDEIVAPILNEVMMGYNCTIFAYGQTGTGKTYTMEGHRVEGNFRSYKDDPESGIIPRTLHQIFEILESQETEYSVKVSSIELYNEELRDLLCESSTEDPNKLRIFEDAAKKGAVIIQGLEEVILQNKNDVYPIIERCTARRQTAATALNHLSSRSHCVFSITIHMKETTPEGEELLKIGKLNLVDLAGSENIGRSGAINQRAREAGNINQSLLTLGRVITALVERSPHVPYRESKLTRLLQDSLGGHTRTCIIATISPSFINLEETLSTLDYAYRAKNIKNRPEVNQKLTKKALIREYTAEIERLKRDVIAAREKNGIYVSEENFQAMEKEIKTQKELIAELQTKMEVFQSERNDAVGKLYEVQDQLESTQLELDTTQANLAETQNSLVETSLNLEKTLVERDEARYLVEEHVQTETQLSAQASSLLATVKTCLANISSLEGKLSTMTSVVSILNTVVVSHNENTLSLLAGLEQEVTKGKHVMSAISSETSRHIFETLSKMTTSHKNQLVPLIDSLKEMLNEQSSHIRSWSTISSAEAASLLGITSEFCEHQQSNLSAVNKMLELENAQLRQELAQSVAALTTQAQQHKEASVLKRESIVAQLTALVDQVFDETNNVCSRVTASANELSTTTSNRLAKLCNETSAQLSSMADECRSTLTAAVAKTTASQDFIAQSASLATQKIKKSEKTLEHLVLETNNLLFGSDSNSLQSLLTSHDLITQEHIGEGMLGFDSIHGLKESSLSKTTNQLQKSQQGIVSVFGDHREYSISNNNNSNNSNSDNDSDSDVNTDDNIDNSDNNTDSLEEKQDENMPSLEQLNTELSQYLMQKLEITKSSESKNITNYPETFAKTKSHETLLQHYKQNVLQNFERLDILKGRPSVTLAAFSASKNDFDFVSSATTRSSLPAAKLHTMNGLGRSSLPQPSLSRSISSGSNSSSNNNNSNSNNTSNSSILQPQRSIESTAAAAAAAALTLTNFMNEEESKIATPPLSISPVSLQSPTTLGSPVASVLDLKSYGKENEDNFMVPTSTSVTATSAASATTATTAATTTGSTTTSTVKTFESKPPTSPSLSSDRSNSIVSTSPVASPTTTSRTVSTSRISQPRSTSSRSSVPISTTTTTSTLRKPSTRISSTH